MLIAVVMTASFMVIEAVAAWWTGSLALLADAAHMLADSAALLLALVADRLAGRPADTHRSYGYGRIKVLASFVNSLALAAVAIWIAIEALMRLSVSPEIKAAPMLVVAVLGLLVNLAAFAVLHGGSHDINVRGAAIHVMGDLLASIAAIVAAMVILIWGWMPIDALLSLAVAGLILRSAFRLGRETGHILLEGTPAVVDVAALTADLTTSLASVENVHHVHVWQLSDQCIAMTLHVVPKPGRPQQAILDEVRHYLAHRYGPIHATIQVESAPCSTPCS